MKRILKITLSLLAITLLGAGSAPAVSIDNDLTDAAAVAVDFNEYIGSQNNSDWSYTNDFALAQDGSTNTFLEGGAVLDWVTADTDQARSYLGTVYSNWMGHSWTAHVAVEAPSSTKPWIFFGMGDPTPNEGYYNEPSDGQGIFVRWQSGSSGSKIMVVRNGSVATNTGTWQGDPGYDIYMTYNHTNKTVQFEIDNWAGGTRGFGTDIDVDCGEISVDGFLTDTNKMHIFFGANAKVTFRDFDVVDLVEEPSVSGSQWFAVEAEDYTSQSGTQLEACSDAGGGTNVAYISDGDWCLYEDIVLGTGDALLKFRAARPADLDDGKIEVRLDSSTGTLLGEVDVPETGGWQTWETLILPVSGLSGTNDVVLVFTETSTTNGGSIFNFNWWSRSPLVEAEDYTAGVNYSFESISDVGGGQALNYINADEWMEYTIHVETTGLHQIDFRVSANGGGDGIAVVSDGVTNATMSVSDTGGWQSWETQSTFVDFTETGEQTLRLAFLSGGFNLNWFSFEPVTVDPVALTVGTSPNQMMRYGMDYERLSYWKGTGLDPVPDWTVNDCNIDYIRTAVHSGYELTEDVYDLDAYFGDVSGDSKDKIIPMMTAMQNANPNIKWFASPRPLNSTVSGASWQPYPIWITGATTISSGDYDFDPIKCAQYLIRYLRLMKHYGFKISYLDLTNEWQSNDYGARITQSNARDLVEYMKAYIANPPAPASDPTDPTGFYAANYPALETGDMPLTVGASSWEYSQGESWISNLDDERRRAAIDIASSHNTNRDDGSGTEQSFADQVHTTLGADTEIWQTEVHGWKNKSGANEATSFEHMMMAIRAGFSGLNGWLALGGTNEGHTYLWWSSNSVSRGMKYYIFQKLCNTSNYGYALDIDEPAELNNTMALIHDNLLTVWLNNMSTDRVLADIDFAGHVWDGSGITVTRWNESLSIEGVVGAPYSNTSTSLEAIIEGESLYCIEIPLVDNEDNFPFVQAENYTTASGVSVAPCADTGGGGMIVFSDAADEITFDLDVTRTGRFGVGFRVSSASANIQFELYDGTNLLASIDEPATGGAQTWSTVSQMLDLDGGPMTLKIVATGGGWNLNWIEFEHGTVPSSPGGLYTTVGTMTVDLDWDAADDADGYDVKRSTVNGSGYVSLGSTTGLTYTDATVEEDQTYYYVVSATNQYGEHDSTTVTGYGLPYDIIGPASSYAGTNPELEKDNLFDKDVTTFYDTTDNNSWAGLDFGENNEQQITQVDYVLRDWSLSVDRTTNATFQGANTADFSDAETLYTVPTDVSAYPTVNTAVISNTKGFRYFRMLAAPGFALYGVAELDVTSVAAVTANGTPISWLTSNGLTSADDGLDSDGDGLLTWEEYIAGTQPTNSGSVLEVDAIHDSASGMVITWQSIAGKSYSIITNGNLTAPNKGTAAFGIIGVEGETSHTTTVNSASSMFFEVGVE